MISIWSSQVSETAVEKLEVSTWFWRAPIKFLQVRIVSNTSVHHHKLIRRAAMIPIKTFERQRATSPRFNHDVRTIIKKGTFCCALLPQKSECIRNVGSLVESAISCCCTSGFKRIEVEREDSSFHSCNIALLPGCDWRDYSPFWRIKVCHKLIVNILAMSCTNFVKCWSWHRTTIE